MADSEGGDVTAAVAVVTDKEDVQNQANENSENELVENGGGEQGEMEVDEIDKGTTSVEEATPVEDELDVKKCEESTVQNESTDAERVAPTGEPENETKTIKMEQEEKTEEGTNVEESTSIPPEGTQSQNNSEVSTEVKTESEIKTEVEDAEGDSYMVLEEADGDDNDSNATDEEELTENEQLRRANRELTERLSLLEEFVEVEFSDKFDKFIKKRAHLIEVMGLGEKNTGQKCNGKRASKSHELVGLLKIVNEQARSPRKNYNRNNSSRGNQSSPNKASTSTSNDKSKDTVNSTNAKKDEPSSSDAKARRCHRCKAVGHMVRECPLPIDPRDRRVILKKDKRESRREKRERDRLEAIQNPKIKAMRDRRRRIGRALNRERQKMK